MKHLGSKVLMITLLSFFTSSWVTEAHANWGGPGCCGPSYENMYMNSSYPIGGGYGSYYAGYPLGSPYGYSDYGYGSGHSFGDYNGYGGNVGYGGYGGYGGNVGYGGYGGYGGNVGYGENVSYGGYGGYGGGCGNSCNSGCCASKAPLSPCQVSFTARGGVAPIIYADRQKAQIRNFVAIGESSATISDTPVLTLNENLVVQTQEKRTPQFCDQFNTPWIAGGEFALAVTCNTEIFVDGDYLKAEGRKNNYTVRFPSLSGTLFPTVVVKPEETVRVREKYSDLESYDAHLGFRYYFPRCCGASFFFGSKVGLRHWNEVCVNARTATTTVVGGEETTVFRNLGNRSYYPDQTVVSGGFQIGLNYCLGKCLSFVIQAEALASGPFKFGRNRTVDNLSVSQNPPLAGAVTAAETRTVVDVPVRRMGTIFVFPITLGLRFTF